MVVLEVTKAETAHSETSTATQMLPRDGAATALAAEDLATNSAMVAASQSCELAGAVVALHRDVVGHPVLPALLGLPPGGEEGGELVEHHLRAAGLHAAHHPTLHSHRMLPIMSENKSFVQFVLKSEKRNIFRAFRHLFKQHSFKTHLLTQQATTISKASHHGHYLKFLNVPGPLSVP